MDENSCCFRFEVIFTTKLLPNFTWNQISRKLLKGFQYLFVIMHALGVYFIILYCLQ